MTGPADFLARWSRRKREAARPATPPADSVPAAEPTPEAEPVVDLSTLPKIEEIGAGTDIRAFLQQGVPPDLTRAALRRLWETDPAIRDYVGFADYDWDFHTPGALAGFGPLRPGDDVARMVRQVFEEIASDNQSQITAHTSQSETESATATTPARSESTSARPETIPVSDGSPRPEALELPSRKRHGGALPT